MKHCNITIVWLAKPFHDVLRAFSSSLSLIHNFHKHLLDVCHVPDSVLFSRDLAVQVVDIGTPGVDKPSEEDLDSLTCNFLKM